MPRRATGKGKIYEENFNFKKRSEILSGKGL
jgi:hypothetical protein